MPSAVLVPVDGSNFAEHALPYALGIARRTGATLHLALVHVPAETAGPAYPLTDAIEAHQQEQRDQEADYLQDLVERLAPGDVPVRSALLTGRIAPALGRHVEEVGIDLIVMTTHGRGGFQRTWLGSTADSLIRQCSIPILLARPDQRTRAIGPDSDCTMDRVLVALDGSEIAEAALQDALRLGITRHAALTLAHVLQPQAVVTAPYLPEGVQLTHDELDQRESSMTEYLERVAASEALQDWQCDTRVGLDYNPAPSILDLAEKLDADLIVVGTHGRGGLRRLILGSVADKIIRGTQRPVLVHRGPSRDDR